MLIYEGGENIKKYPYIKQRGLKECGPACVQMILKYYGGYVNINKLSEMMYTNQNGTTAYNMNETLKKLGFSSIGLKTNSLTDLKLPCIAHVIINHSYQHYIVLYKVNYKKQTLLIADPATSLKQITFKEFNQIWSGVIIQMHPIKPIAYEHEPNTLKFIWYYIKKNLKLVLLGGFLTLFVSLLSTVSTLFLPIIIQNFHRKTITLICTLFLLLFLLKNILNLIKSKILIKLNLNLDKQLYTDIFLKILNLPYRYYRRKTTGEITSYFNDLYVIKDAINHFSQILLIDLPLLILLCIIVLKLNFILSIIIAFCLIFYFIIYKKTNIVIAEEMTRQKYQLNSYIIEAISGFETIKNLNVKSKIYDKFIDYYQSLNITTKKVYTQSETLSFIKNSFENIIILIIIVILSKNNCHLNYLIIIYIAITFIINIIKNIFEFNYSLDQLNYSLSSIMELKSISNNLTNTKADGDIKIENLNFSYNKQSYTLKNINLKIESSSKVMVTGNSGSGKTTLFKILKGYYKDYEGNMTIGNKEIKNHFFEDIIYVSPKEILFTGTLEDNLNLKYKNKENNHICEIENITKNKYQLIEENGFNLSSGQKQRIVLARALCNFNILIIDEGLNQVSSDMERRILKKIFKKYQDKTIIYISHRLDNLDLFDRFVKIEHGQVVLNTKRNN